MMPTKKRPRVLIVFGTQEDHYKGIRHKAAASTGFGWWTTHQDAQRGDTVLFYLVHPVSSFVARGKINGRVKPLNNPGHNWHGRSGAAIDQVELLLEPVPLSAVRPRFREWAYLRQPHMSTFVPDDLTERFMRFLDNYQKPGAPEDLDLSWITAKEGKKTLAQHIRRERKRFLVDAKKHQFIAEHGSLTCEACAVDLETQFGKDGAKLYEVHHTRPLAGRGLNLTSLEDLAILCPNCHRFIHRRKPMISLRALRKRIGSRLQKPNRKRSSRK